MTTGLSAQAIDAIESRHGFRFAPEHRSTMTIAMPAGGRWPDWRGDSDQIQERLDWAINGVVFAVERDAFWHPDSG